LPFSSADFLFLPMNFFMGFSLFMVCSCISSHQIRFCTLCALSLFGRPFLALTLTGAYGSAYSTSVAMHPKMKFMILEVTLYLFGQKLNI
jgi:hypothetical protein